MGSLERILNPWSTEQSRPNEVASPNDPGQPQEPAIPNGSASPNGPTLLGKPSLLTNANTLSDRSGHGASTSEQPQLSATAGKQLVDHNGQRWEYEGFEWPKPGILSLNLKPVGSNSANELVREAYIQHDNPRQLLRLWKVTPRPVYPDDPNLYEIFAVLRHKELKNEKGKKENLLRVQWTGFSEKDTSWEVEAHVEQVAPEVLNEYWSKRAKSPAKKTERVVKTAKQPKRRRPQRRARQQ